jgi:hypothetical protein
MDEPYANEILSLLNRIDDDLTVIRKAVLSLALRQSGDDRDQQKAQGLLEDIRPR